MPIHIDFEQRALERDARRYRVLQAAALMKSIEADLDLDEPIDPFKVLTPAEIEKALTDFEARMGGRPRPEAAK